MREHIKYESMILPPNGYCGDEAMSEYLTKTGSRIDIHGLYGFFYGCLAASKVAIPYRYVPMILSREDAAFEAEEESKEMLMNIMKLWSVLSRWNPEREPFVFPDTEYIASQEGLRERVKDDISLVNYFVKGLDLCGAAEGDLSDDGIEALRYLSEADFFVDKYTELTRDENIGDKVIEKTFDLIDQLEEIMVECIVTITVDLRKTVLGGSADAEILSDERTQGFQGASAGIGGHEICPCGSGRKYGKCCGLTH